MKLKIGDTIEVVPPGKYQVIIREIRENTSFKRKALEFFGEIADGPHKGTPLKAFCNADYKTFSNRTKLFHWYAKATGDESLTSGDEMDTDDFLNKVLEVQVETKVSKKTRQEFSNIVEINKLVREL